MTPEQAAWVYKHVILGYHDANQAHSWCGPGQADDRLICACQLPCTWCRSDRHDICASTQERWQKTTAARQWRPGWSPETYLHGPGPWRPPTRKRPLWLPVWLADRICRYLCSCTVCTTPAAPTPASVAVQVPTVALVLPAVSEQLGLFEEVSR